MSIDFAGRLNAEQLAAVTAGEGPTLVISAAGTGKTRTLTHRLAWLMEERRVPAWRIWLLTFTNRAAREMLERAAQLVGEAQGAWGGTFHHMANRVLRRHAERLGYTPGFAILDEDDSAKLIKQAIEEVGCKDRAFPKPDVLHSVLSLAANRETDPEIELEARFGKTPVPMEALLDVARLYGEKKREANAMDFDDLLVNAVKLLRECPDVAESYQERVLHVLVDEYQDTNRLQSAFVDLLSAKHGNLMAVGDDFQSIYSWRGADIRHILSFGERHPGARIIKLEENYRSTPEILNLANGVIAGNPEQFQKTLRAARGEGYAPVRVNVANGRHQARWVAEEIRRLMAQGMAADEIAVLYRAHFHSMELQMELTRSGVPFVLMSGVRFFEQAHVKDLCSLLRLTANPGDALAFYRFAELFVKVGPKKARQIWAKLGGSWAVRDAAARARFGELLPSGGAKEQWARLEEALLGEGEAKLDDPGHVVKKFVEAFYGEYATLSFDNGETRLEDAAELVEQARRFGSVQAFIEEMALLTNLDSKSDRDRQNGVRMSTIHQAKGLEWRAVFLLWAVEGMFPGARVRAAEDGGDAAMQEERRLFYVTVTRAKDRLWLMVPKTRKMYDGSIEACEPSIFVQELDEGLMESVEPPVPGDCLERTQGGGGGGGGWGGGRGSGRRRW